MHMGKVIEMCTLRFVYFTVHYTSIFKNAVIEKKLRLREVKQLSQDHTAEKQQPDLTTEPKVTTLALLVCHKSASQ